MEPAFELSSVPYGPATGVAQILLTNLTWKHTRLLTHIYASDKYDRIWASHGEFCAKVAISLLILKNVKQTFGKTLV